MKMQKILSMVMVLSICSMGKAQAPFYVSDGLYDTSNTATLGLPKAEGTQTYTVFAPNDASDHFSHGAVMIAFKGNLYCMWQSAKTDEDAAETWVAYSRSEDEGITWSDPMVLAKTIEDGYCSSGGWWTNGDTLIGYINTWPNNLSPKSGYTRYVASADGLQWSEPSNVLMADGSTMNGIFEQDPHILPDGRIVNSAHFQPGLHIAPIYTDDPLGIRGWKKGCFTYTNNGDQSREMEPSIFRQADGTLVMIFRDQNSSYHKLAAVSIDRGCNWTSAVLTNMPDARTKQSAGNLPDGTAFMAGNPVGNKRRVPLVLTLSRDGKSFDAAYLLRGDGDIQPLRYTGKAKSANSGYSYPKSMIAGDFLYVSYATNKEDVQFTRVPLTSIFLNGNGIDEVCKEVAIDISVSLRRLNVCLKEECCAEITICSLTGNCLYQKKSVEPVFEDNLDELPCGLYVVKVKTAQCVQSKVISLNP